MTVTLSLILLSFVLNVNGDYVFPPLLDNAQYEAEVHDSGTHLSNPFWVAQVKCKLLDMMMCTALRPAPYYFVIPSRCLVTLRVPFTSITAKPDEKLRIKAFIQPRKPTRQMYNDLSYIITEPITDPSNILKSYTRSQYESIAKFTEANPWINDPFQEKTGYLLGYVAERDDQTGKMKNTLYTLAVTMSAGLCPDMNDRQYKKQCFSSCTALEKTQKNVKCHKYLRGLGMAAYVPFYIGNIYNGYFMGSASWAVVNGTESYPVGFAEFNIQFNKYNLITSTCAGKIADDHTDGKQVTKQLFYDLCRKK